ncbi:branched-chain amino acid transporter permease [Methanolobus sp. WCC5]|uniref:branched-chain amino acid transporter permease n=1 Tax=Methanolobus sp. WCC5 TaxID=3125785 RepID=UPI00325162CF
MLNDDLLLVVLVTALITAFTRALPFLFFTNRRQPEYLKVIERDFPPMIMVLLVFYCLKDVAWDLAPFGIPEILCILIVAGLHIWKNNALLSIFAGTILYMYLIRSEALINFLINHIYFLIK